MQQVFYIHGGDAYSKHEDFLNNLRNAEIRNPKGEKKERWTETLREDLGQDFDLYKLSMPNSDNANYEEWKIWFERYFEFMEESPILVGWSLGGMFLLKYVSENNLPIKPKALFVLASPAGAYESDYEPGNDCANFQFDLADLPAVSEKVPEIVLFHSEDDFVVPYEHVLQLKDKLPEAELVSFADRNHFLQEEFPELITKIKEVTGK